MAVLGLVSGGLWTMGLVMDWVVFPRTLGTTAPLSAFFINLSAAVAGFAVFGYARYSPRVPDANATPRWADALELRLPGAARNLGDGSASLPARGSRHGARSSF